jgi:FkbH-like protein
MLGERWRALTIQVTDRFGDNGIVGVAILKIDGDLCEIDTLLLSCRVIGRTLETAFLSALAREAIASGAKRLAGWFIPSARNGPAADFYQQHGFAAAREQDAAVWWEIDLSRHMPAAPPWIVLEASPR